MTLFVRMLTCGKVHVCLNVNQLALRLWGRQKSNIEHASSCLRLKQNQTDRIDHDERSLDLLLQSLFR